MLVALIVLCPTTVQAKSLQQPPLEQLADEALSVYLFVRNCIAIPVLIVRYASHGFQILGSVFLTRGAEALDKVKKDILYTTLALLTLFLLPVLIGWGRKLFEGSRWRPPKSAILLLLEGCL